MNPQDLRVILATDCGSTTTKAILIQKLGDEYRQTHRGEAPTTVEAPFEDVTRGVLNAIQEVEELSGRRSLMVNGSSLRQTARLASISTSRPAVLVVGCRSWLPAWSNR